MKVKLYRKHLAEELRNLNIILTKKHRAFNSHAVQSYAVTTAILLRKIVQHLNISRGKIKRIKVPDANRQKDICIMTVLNAIIHYVTFDREQVKEISPEDEKNEAAVRLYFTGRNGGLKYGKNGNPEYFIMRLSDYVCMASRFACDDMFFFRHLLIGLSDYLDKFANRPDKNFDQPHLDAVSDLIDDALVFTSNMIASNSILPLRGNMRVLENMPSGVLQLSSEPACSSVEFVFDYSRASNRCRPGLYKVRFVGESVYVAEIQSGQKKLLLSTGDLHEMFTKIKKQVEASQGWY